jgi:uncharacterized protein (DUF342 family)
LAEPPKLSYVATSQKIRCEFSKATALEISEAPTDLISRAKAKLKQVQSSGQIGFYIIFEQRIKSVWTALANNPDDTPAQKVCVTLAAGAPNYQGITCEKSDNAKCTALVDIEIPREQLSGLRYDWFKLNLFKKIKDLGINDPINNAQIYSLFQRLTSRGEAIKKFPLNSVSSYASIQPNKKIALMANKIRKEIVIIMRDISEMRTSQNIQNLLNLVDNAAKQMSIDGVVFKIFKKDTILAIKSALEGPENYGVDLPLTILAAQGEVKAMPAKSDVDQSQGYPGMNKLNLRVTDDKMMVLVEHFDMGLYNDKSFQVSLEWVKKEIKRNSFKAQMTTDIADEISVAIEKKETLEKKIVLRGLYSMGGRQPYLKSSFKEPSSMRPQTNLEVDIIDIRDMQQRFLVKKGQIVAELFYRTPPVIGYDVFGKPLPPAPNDELTVITGDGIVESEPGKYFADADGIPVVESDTVSLNKIFVYEGDVNLSTGNIRFDGPVEIKGAIDSGAVVETSSDLIINGEIRGGIVDARGNITVKGGITTSDKGFVYCGGNLTADFIENSRLTVKGDIIVKKALINSKIICGAGIRATNKDSLIAGGTIIAKESVYTSNLGFARGALSVLNIGIDWKAARAIEIRKARLDKILALQQTEKANFRDLVRQTKNHTNQKQKSRKDELQERIKKMKNICDKLEVQINQFQAGLSYNTNAVIYVTELLMSNVNITIGGNQVPVKADFKNVCVLAKKRRDSFIVPFEEIEKESSDHLPKKAG